MSRMIGRIEIDEEEHVTLLDRVTVNSGLYVTQSAVTSVQVQVIGPGSEGVVWDTDLEASDVIYDSLQVDGYWTDDQLGYNVRYTLDSSVGMVGGRAYRVVITINTDDFGPKYSQWEVRVRDVPSVDTW